MTAQVRSSDMKGDAEHPSWLVSIYQSVFHFIFGFVLNIFQEFFKPGMDKGDKATSSEDFEASPDANNSSISGKGRVAPAGEVAEIFQNDKEKSITKENQYHTVVDLPSAESVGSTEKPQPISTFLFPSSYTPVEPTADQSKNTLVIKNLPFKYKPTDLDALLAEHQAKPKNVRLLRDDAGRFSGMAFIRCITKEEAQRLIFRMHDLEIGGRNIQVEFKMKKKKKGSLRTSSDEVSSLNSSTDELPVVNKLRISAENSTVITDKLPQQQPPQVPLTQPPSGERTCPPPPGLRKLAISAEHNFSDKFKRAPQMRRKSTSAVLESAPYAHSALYRIPNLSQASAGPSIRPIRQPLGPDGKTNGFSLEYRLSRAHQ